MKKIVTIGGGSHAGNLHINQEIVKLTGKKKPKLLFIPTASSDEARYVEVMEENYGALGCTVKSLLLLKQVYSKKELSELILGADIIYVGGGNTLMMMRKWRQLGVDKLLRQAWQKGTVMCGVSAGSICWYESGHSDSMWYNHTNSWDYIRVHGLNFLPFIHCPHYDSETGGKKRKNDFKRMMKKYPGKIGITCDDNVAIEYLDEKFRVLSNQKTSHAYRVYWKRGKFYEERLESNKTALIIGSLKV